MGFRVGGGTNNAILFRSKKKDNRQWPRQTTEIDKRKTVENRRAKMGEVEGGWRLKHGWAT